MKQRNEYIIAENKNISNKSDSLEKLTKTILIIMLQILEQGGPAKIISKI